MVFNIEYIMNFINHKKKLVIGHRTLLGWYIIITVKYFKTISKFYNKHYVLPLLQENTAGAVDMFHEWPCI